uniref:hypothetical protein n=1 Tax=Thiolapillus sp. TaxID=2017437 RepID=UPI003AF56020
LDRNRLSKTGRERWYPGLKKFFKKGLDGKSKRRIIRRPDTVKGCWIQMEPALNCRVGKAPPD